MNPIASVALIIFSLFLPASLLASADFTSNEIKAINSTMVVNNANGNEVRVSFDMADTEKPFCGQLLNLVSGKNLIYSFVLDYNPCGESFISLISPDKLERKPMPGFAIKKDGSVFFVFDFNQKEHKAVIKYNGETISFNGFSIGTVGRCNVASFPNDNNVKNILVQVADSNNSSHKFNNLPWLVLLFLLDSGAIVCFYIKRKRKVELDSSSIEKERVSNIALKPSQKHLSSSIRLFGGFEVYDKDGKEISIKFTPMLKELFFLLLCFTPDKGISSQRIKELLWYDKDEHSAKNNRSVYITKLRSILLDVGDGKIVVENKQWQFVPQDIDVDFFKFRSIVGKKYIAKSEMEQLLDILENGNFLDHYEYQWLDDIKSAISDTVIMLLGNYLISLDTRHETDLVIRISDVLFSFDSLNEVALIYKCRAYKEYGKHVLAKQLYHSFVKEYQLLYGEEYSKSFVELMSDIDSADAK